MNPLLFILLLSVASAQARGFPFGRARANHQCQGSTQTCSDSETCCSDEAGGYLCCMTTDILPSQGGSCCGGGCCSHGESCCADDQGSTCCLVQNSFCVPKDSSTGTYPARCCPRWTVGCAVGSVGCCDPAQAWQRLSIEKDEDSLPRSTLVSKDDRFFDEGEDAIQGTPAYALVVSGAAKQTAALLALTIDTSTGKIARKLPVTGFAAHDPAGESTREFLWDTKRKLFYYFDANFTANGGARPAGGRDTYLVSVDPTTGQAKPMLVEGAKDYPTGYALHEDGHVRMATEAWDNAGKSVVGYHFYSVDPEEAKATLLASNVKGSGESGNPEFYAGYHRGVSVDGSSVYRLGYEEVTQMTTQGLGVTTVASGSKATTKWVPEPAQGHDFFLTFDRLGNDSALSGGGETFLSLAPSTSKRSRSLDVVQWSIEDSNTYEVIASFPNAHPPRATGLGTLGYVATTLSGNSYAALVVEYGMQPMLDRWSIAVVDLSSPKNSTMHPLSPWSAAGIWSASGLGL
mmetsp:Transcript_28096/g.45235  ORF Transcript_28096/g.45235 Transcript_28096/m.45235 type:complete len:517 (-) Transcript_28096:123-1673(-)